MMKKIFAIVLLAFCFCLAGCGGTDSIHAKDPQPTVTATPNSTNSTKAQSETNKENIKLVDSGWSTSKSSNYAYVHYAVKIENPNNSYAINFPKIVVTAKDGDGKILKNEEQTLMNIAAGDTITYGNSVSYEGAVASSVEISVKNGKDDFVKQDDSKYVKSSDFSIKNISENKSTFSNRYTGELTNNSSVEFKTVAVSIIYKAGDKMIGGAIGFVKDVGAMGTVPFEISGPLSNVEGYDSFELCAIQW